MIAIKTVSKIGVLIALCACTQPVSVDRGALDRVGAAVTLEMCCDAKRKVPPAVTRAFERCAMPVVTAMQNMELRAGYLADKPDAQRSVLSISQPLDLFATSLKGRVSGQLSLGYFSHMSIYVGDAKALRAMGLWHHPAVRPWQSQLETGPMVIEAMAPVVALAGRDKIFAADSLVVLRPQGLTQARKRTALLDAFKSIGTPFDATFDAGTDDKVFCSELPARVMPEVNLPLRSVYGRPSYLPDEAVAHSLQGKIPMKVVRFVLADQKNWTEAEGNELAARILAYWPEAGASN